MGGVFSWLRTPEFMVLEHSDSFREWAGPKEMDTGLLQWLLL